jgi:precorrin-4/cobalt-precorrin-4 C11-methyltransferase
MQGKVWIVGAGPGAPDLLTIRAARLLREADMVVYTDSLLDDRILREAKATARIVGSAAMTLEEIVGLMEDAVRRGEMVVRLHSGDPSVFGAVAEQLRALRTKGIPYEIVPGVSAAFAAAAALGIELTVPDVSQAVILARASGRTPVPEGQRLRELASHRATLVLYLSAGLLDTVVTECLSGGYSPDTPCAIVYKASWPDQKVVRTPLIQLADAARAQGIANQAVIVVGESSGDAIWEGSFRSRLYSPDFTHTYRRANEPRDRPEAPPPRLPDPGSVVACRLEGKDLALLWHKGKLVAVPRWCPHRGGDLAQGLVLGGSLVCADHGWSFNLDDGSPASSSTKASVEIFDVREEGGQWIVVKRSP